MVVGMSRPGTAVEGTSELPSGRIRRHPQNVGRLASLGARDRVWGEWRWQLRPPAPRPRSVQLADPIPVGNPYSGPFRVGPDAAFCGSGPTRNLKAPSEPPVRVESVQ